MQAWGRGLLGVLLLTLAALPGSPRAGPAEPAAPPIHLVFFDDPPLPVYRGGLPGLEATHPRSRGRSRLDPRSPASRAYLAWLDSRHAAHLEDIRRAIGRDPKVVFRYRAAASGLALRIRGWEAAAVAALPGVTRVTLDRMLPLHTDRTPAFLGADAIWDGTATGVATQGEGVIIGVIDSGVNHDHPSFSASPVDGHVFTNPFGAGNFIGWCDPANPDYDPQFACNDKLIGAWDFTDAIVSTEDDGPEDDNGHGTHTASTAAGNHVDYDGDGVADMSGVAPHASLITYDACFTSTSTGIGLCAVSSATAAIDQAILDGVDVINFSLGGGFDPWSGLDADPDTSLLNAVAAGVFPAASAGNSGPTPGTSSHRGPWVLAVAATSHDREIHRNSLADMSGGAAPPPADLDGASRTPGYGPAPLVYAGDSANGEPDPELCTAEFPPGTWSGEIVVCDEGGVPRVMAGQNVLAGGAGGLVLANVDGDPIDINDEVHLLPAIHVNRTSGDALRAWLASGSGHVATITDPVVIIDLVESDRVLDFSSRGPSSLDTVKPDVSGPGANVFAATADGLQDGLTPYVGVPFDTRSGTSMASPHAAGVAALVRALHPTWTAPELHSALTSTATTAVFKGDGVTPADPFDVGGGRIDAVRAVRAGLVLDETEASFRAADPSLLGDARTLNVANMADVSCPGVCSWQRTVTSVAGSTVSWTANTTGPGWMNITPTPSSFSLAPGASQTIDVQVTFTPGAPTGFWTFGEVRLVPADPGVSDAHLPLAVGVPPLPDLAHAAHAVDDSLANGDGVVDPHEVITMSVDLRNNGAASAAAVSGVLSTTTPDVTILGADASWPDVAPGAVGASEPPHFTVHVGGTVPCGTDIDFHLELAADPIPTSVDFQQRVGADVAPTGLWTSTDTPLAIPDNNRGEIQSTIVVPETFSVYSLLVSLDISHTAVGDLEVDVSSPSGTTIRLHDRSGGDGDDLNTTYPFPTLPDGPGETGDFGGEPVNGPWTLTVRDRSSKETGTLNSWSIGLTGPAVLACAEVPCFIVADAQAVPDTVCQGDALALDASASAEYGVGCSGALEYRFEEDGLLVQDWSSDAGAAVTPFFPTLYTVRVRDSVTVAEGVAAPPVTVNGLPTTTVTQAPDPMCEELAQVELDAGAGFASYAWRDDTGVPVGASQLLSLDGSACGRTYSVDLGSDNGCTGVASRSVACTACAPGEVSGAASPVAFRMGVDPAMTVEFERLPDPDLLYHLYSADSVLEMLAGEWSYKYCDLENAVTGTWTPVDAVTARWTPLIPDALAGTYWIVVAERATVEGPYGFSSGGAPRPRDLDGAGSAGSFGCP